MSLGLLEDYPVKGWLLLAEGQALGFCEAPGDDCNCHRRYLNKVEWTEVIHWLQLSAAPEVQQLSLSGMELCVG